MERDPRLSFVRSVLLTPRDGPQRRSWVINISRSGMFVSLSTPYPKGAVLSVAVELDEAVLEFAEGVVVWNAPSVNEPNKLVGMGIKFTEVTIQAKPLLEQWLARLSPRGSKAGDQQV